VQPKIDPTSLFPSHEVETAVGIIVAQAEDWAAALMASKRKRVQPVIVSDPLLAALAKPEIVDGAIQGLLAKSLLEKALSHVRESHSPETVLKAGRG
jgi:hypothetical protein